jgi:hypothetical protein
MVFAQELSVDAILEAVRSGRTVVKINGIDGPMIETELSGERTGDTVYSDVSTLSAVVTGAVGRSLEVIKNGEAVETLPITSDPFTHEMVVQAPEEGEDRYRYQVMMDNTPQAVGSYVWLRAPEPGSGGCWVARVGEADTAALVCGAVLLLFWRRRRRPA